MRNLAVFLLALNFALPASSQSDPTVAKATALAHDIEKRISACPKRVVITSFPRKHKTIAWVKETWGPPAGVLVDMHHSDSLMYPFLITVEFTLWMAYGPEHSTKAAAEAETTLNPLTKAKYRNVYLVGDNSIHLESIQLSNASGTWHNRPSWEDACWDHVDGGVM